MNPMRILVLWLLLLSVAQAQQPDFSKLPQGTVKLIFDSAIPEPLSFQWSAK